MYKVILTIADKHCPYKQCYARKILPKWMNIEILETMSERDRLYKLAKSLGNPEIWATMRQWRNICNRMVAKAKNEFVLLQLNECTNDLSKFWRVIDSVFGENSNTRKEIKIVDPVSQLVLPENECPDYMNNFLVTTGPSLAAEIPSVPFYNTFTDFVTNLRLTRITVDETMKVIDSIDIRKSSAIDYLTSCILKDALKAIPIHLNFIFNLSIDQGTFPTSWKKANVILIPKDGPKDSPNS